MTNTLNFASGNEESYVVRYSSNVPPNSIVDVTHINEVRSAVSTDIFGNPIDFDQDGLTDIVFPAGLVDEYIGYVSTPGGTDAAASHYSQTEVAFGGGRSGAALSVTNIGPGGTALAGFPDTEALTVADRVAVLDINSDGYQDIFAWSSISNIVTAKIWTYIPGTRTFTPATERVDIGITGSRGFGEVSLGDLNGDGAPEVISPNYTLSNDIYEPVSYTIFFGVSNGNGGWNGRIHTSGVLAPITLSLATPIRKAGLGSGLPTRGSQAITPAVRDFDGDGDLDLAVPTQTGISIYTNPGDGQFDPNSAINIASGSLNPTAGLYLKTADVNNDGKLDIITSPNSNSEYEKAYSLIDHESITLYLNRSTGNAPHFEAIPVPGLGVYALTNGPIATGDMDLDGNVDLVISPVGFNNDRFYIALGDGAGHFGNPSIWPGYSNLADPLRPVNINNRIRGITDIETGDFDGDGQLDVLSLANDGRGLIGDLSVNSIYGVAYNRTYNPLSITTTALPAGTAGAPYSAQLQAAGGDSSRAYSFQLSANSLPLPSGLSLQPDGTITGTPQSSGSFVFLAEVSQANGLRGAASPIAVDLSNSIGSGGSGGGSTAGDSIIKATLKADRLIGTNKPDTFLFPNIRTGTNPKTNKHDKIIGYQSDDIIKIKGFKEHVIGEGSKRRKIFNSYGTVRNLSKKAINELLGDNFKPRDAAVFQVQGIRGSFLAVNKRGVGFNKNDMLVHFVDFVPSSDSPLTLA